MNGLLTLCSRVASSIVGFALVFLGGCGAVGETPPRTFQEPSIYVKSVEGPKISSLRLVALRGELDETVADCGIIHLSEHLIGKSIRDKATSLRKFGFRINGATGPDRTMVAIDVGGGVPGLERALEVLRQAIELPTFDASDVAAEIKLIQSEERLFPSGLSRRLALAGQPVGAATGRSDCSTTLSLDRVKQAYHGIWSQSPKRLILISGGAYDRASYARAMIAMRALRDDAKTMRTQFTGSVAATRYQQGAMHLYQISHPILEGKGTTSGAWDAIELWHAVAALTGHRAPPKFLFFGNRSVSVSFANDAGIAWDRMRTSLHQIAEGKADASVLRAGARAAAQSICRLRTAGPSLRGGDISNAADRAAMDPPSFAATVALDDQCNPIERDDNRLAELARSVLAGLPVEQARVAIAAPLPVTPTTRPDRYLVCRPSFGDNRMLAWAGASLRAALIEKLRWETQAALNVSVTPVALHNSNGEDCLRIEIVGGDDAHDRSTAIAAVLSEGAKSDAAALENLHAQLALDREMSRRVASARPNDPLLPRLNADQIFGWRRAERMK